MSTEAIRVLMAFLHRFVVTEAIEDGLDYSHFNLV